MMWICHDFCRRRGPKPDPFFPDARRAAFAMRPEHLFNAGRAQPVETPDKNTSQGARARAAWHQDADEPGELVQLEICSADLEKKKELLT